MDWDFRPLPNLCYLGEEILEMVEKPPTWKKAERSSRGQKSVAYL